MDEQVFDTYLSTLSLAVSARLLARDFARSLKASVAAFVTQKKMSVEVRTSQSIHDRVIFVDERSCWVLGQSLKDAAKSKPTYLAPLPNDVAQLKKKDYEKIWAVATPLGFAPWFGQGQKSPSLPRVGGSLSRAPLGRFESPRSE